VNDAKGFLFTIDGLLALLFIVLATSTILDTSTNEKNLQEFEISENINDLLMTSQIIEIDSMSELTNNYNQMFGNYAGYVKINENMQTIGNTSKSENLISNSIRYVNKLGQEIYIEIGVYY